VSHILVVANETVAGRPLIEKVESIAKEGDRVTVLAPVHAPRSGYVVYDDTRRASAGRRLERTLNELRAANIAAHGLVVEADPADAVRDTIAQEHVDAIVVSTHPEQKSGWLRRNVVDRIRKVAGSIPVEHVVADVSGESGANVLVIANETVVGGPLMDKIRERAARGPAAFLIVSPQSDPTRGDHPEAEQRLRRALAELRGAGIEAHGQVAHPDPYAAAMEAVQDERVDEIIVSTFPGEAQSSWLRGGVVERLRKDTGLPVEHVEVAREPAEVSN
jgi:hypothetical protein